MLMVDCVLIALNLCPHRVLICINVIGVVKNLIIVEMHTKLILNFVADDAKKMLNQLMEEIDFYLLGQNIIKMVDFSIENELLKYMEKSVVLAGIMTMI